MDEKNPLVEKSESAQMSAPTVQRLWLVRHGATEWNSEQRLCGHRDVPLSTLGRTQARWVARRLRLERIVAIYASDLLRARETAEIIARHSCQPLAVKIEPAWREMSFGDWEGLTYAQVAAQSPHELNFFTDPVHHAPPNGEAFPHLQQRVQTAFAQLASNSIAHNFVERGDIVLVSHGGSMRALLCALLGTPPERQWQLRIDNAALSALDFVPGATDVAATVALVLLNQQPRLRARQLEGQRNDV